MDWAIILLLTVLGLVVGGVIAYIIHWVSYSNYP